MAGYVLENIIREALSNISPNILQGLMAKASTSKGTAALKQQSHDQADRDDEVVLDLKEDNFTAAQLLQPRKATVKGTDAQNTFHVSLS